MSAAPEVVSILQTALQLAEEHGIPVFPCGPDKQPYTSNGFKDASTNLEQIEEWWRRWPDALIAVPTGAASGLLGLDQDPDGAEWYREHADRLDCGRIHRTRRGHHAIYRMPQIEIRNSAGKIAKGIDVRGEGGYIIWWPSHGFDAVGGLDDLTEPPAWLLDLLVERKKPNGYDRGDHDESKVANGRRNDYLSREAYRLRKQGSTPEQILEVLLAFNQARCEVPLDEEEVQQIAHGKAQVEPEFLPPENTRPESLTLDQMLERFVHVARGPLIVDVSNTYRRLRPGEFSAYYAHDKVIIEKKAVPVTTLWSQSDRRMMADCLTFHPGEGQFFTERGLRHLNIWTPPKWPAVDTAIAAPFLEHLEYLIPDQTQREALLDWLAHAAQRPEIRPHLHFLLVANQEGTGRSWLVEILRRVWGERHAGETDLHRLLDDSFNSVLSGKILMAVHEVKAPADERYSHRDRLKSLLTDTSLTVNEKHEPRWTERFCARFLMFTNRDDALPLSETDRRVYAVRCADRPKEPAYYTKLYGLVDDERFLSAVWHTLRARDISRFNPGARAPLNEIKTQMIAAGRTEAQQTAVELVHASPHDVIGSTDLMRMLVPAMEGERYAEHKARESAISAVLREIGCQTSAEKVWLNGTATRVWIIRNAGQWIDVSKAALCKAGKAAAEDIMAERWLPDSVIERWKGAK